LKNKNIFDKKQIMIITRLHVIIFSTILFVLLNTKEVFEEKIVFYKPVFVKKVALTFDDGPHPYFTENIVKIISDYNIKATFFLVGTQVKKFPQLVKLLAENDCCKIGNHTYSHKNLTKLTESEIFNELKTTQEILSSISGEKNVIPYFRPPGGHYNNKVLNIADKLGLKIVLWSVFTNDHNERITEKELINRIMSSLSSDKEIILLHSGSKTTLEFLPKIIEILKEKNYKFVTVDEILKDETYIVN
jgi:peptidoglycan/xylan/chitin deacetylase (PgdA/CDA1 family)